MALPFHAEQRMRASPDAVWAFIQDIGGSGRWMRGTEHMEDLTGPPIAVGSRFLQRRRIHGRVASAEFVVTEMDAEARRLALEVDGRRGSLGRGVFRFRYAMLPDEGGGTQVVVDGEVVLGRAIELVAQFFLDRFVAVVASDLETLRDCVDAATTSSISHGPST
jgi:carbon monoxide dehydrogenase subunit G